MAGRNYRFGGLEIIIIFGESLEGGALKSPFPKPATVIANGRTTLRTLNRQPKLKQRANHFYNE
jgi:hypothetical protein